VFVVATANAVDQLPPEFLRKGRFDEIFFVDIPTVEERADIFTVQLQKRKRDPTHFDINALVSNTENFTGAEVEEAIISGLFASWNDGKREVTTKDIINATKSIIPIAVSMEGRIEVLRTWAEKNARRANGIRVVEQDGSVRVIRR
jgi:SpoVK/Ycf46/Vps4 family AAA+-type ATPase